MRQKLATMLTIITVTVFARRLIKNSNGQTLIKTSVDKDLIESVFDVIFVKG